MNFNPIIPVVIAASALLASAPATAAEIRQFDAQAFATAQAEGRPILVDVYADWCPVCKRQAPIVSELTRAPRFRDLVIFRLNFDTQKEQWRRFGVQRQSTLIAFNGAKETGRSVADTNPKSIDSLIRSTLD